MSGREHTLIVIAEEEGLERTWQQSVLRGADPGRPASVLLVKPSALQTVPSPSPSTVVQGMTAVRYIIFLLTRSQAYGP